MNIRRCFLTGCYFGLIKEAPGTWGTLFGAFLGVLVLVYLPQSTLFMLAVLVTVIAVKEIDRFEKEGGAHDDKSIVIDEIAGIWVGMSFLPEPTLIWIAVLFVLFRIFDITKPSLIGKAEKRLKGGWAVMADDLLAGVVASLSTGIIYLIYSNF